ncbi:MAG TPA: hypothetical protein DCE44_15250, partial [Verrucomicrobiales bacterium]|nr:hypothetical protein [Verrucomicrobiales bacterium]
ALMLDGVIEQRGKFSAQGTVALNVRPGVAYLLLAYDPVNHALFTSEGTTPSAGISGDLADFQIRLLAGEPDADADGLPDLVEAVVGTNPRQPDTDGDGVTDLAEIQQGLDPLGGRLAQTGIVASAETPGNAVDICAANNLAVTANEAGGISVFNLGSGQNPIQVAQVTIPGRALRVALAENFAAVAAEAAGLIVVDLTDPAAARIVHQVNVGDTVLSVASMAGLVCVGTRSGEIVLVELASGAILSRLRLGETVRDVGFGAQLLYALTDTRLHAVDYGSATLTHLSSTQSPSPASVNQRLFVGDSIAYAAHPRGNNSFDLSQPHLPRLISAGVTPQFGWKQIVPNGSGLGVAAVGLNLSFDGPHNISIYNLTNRTNTAVFVGEIVTPGIARAVTLYNGLAYVADGPAGLQVINYLPFDQQGRPPSIRLTTSDAPGQAEAGQVLRVTAHVADDVQVAQVGFLLNGEPVFTDGNFPFEFSFVVGEPRLLNSDPFQIQAIARDTGGNSAASEALTLRIVPDAKAPAVRRVSPFDGSMSGTVRVVSAFFSEPIDAATVSSNSFAVINLGADLALGTADDVLIEGTFDVRPELNSASFEPDVAMGPGTYRLRISAPLADAAGNVLATPFESSFRVFDFRDDDGDLVPDEVESALGLNPTLADTDGDGVLDGFEDFDRDGLPNAGEVWAETDPRVADTDGNGRKDGLEDPDGDALDNAHEFAAGTNPLVADTDHDGWTDEAEVTAGSDPLNPRSLPPRFLVARPVLDVAFPSISAGPGTDGLSGQYFAKPPVVVAVPASANGVSPVAAGGFVARPPVRLTVPSVASGTFPVGVGEFIARPPLQVKLPSP